MNRLRDCAALVSFLWMCSAASGQISPLLVIEPWEPESQWADTVDELLFINGGHDKRSGTDIDIFFWDSSGRIKFDRKDADPRFWLGYRILTIDVDAPGVSAIHGELNDVAVVGALRLGESGDWAWTAMAGAGTANDGHFSNDDAIYGIGNLDAARAIDGRSAFHIGVNYDGNRGLLPDVPLPYVAYRYDSDDLSLTLGVLSSSVEWRPIEPITLTVQYSMPENAHAGLAWSLSDNVSLFTEYRRTLDGFYIDGRDHRRIFYELNRAAVGTRVIWGPWVDARVGVGYAFDQEFATGFDVRDLDTAARPSDEVFFFFTVQGKF